MAKVSPIQNNFNGGELSPQMMGRQDTDKYKSGLEICENFIPIVQGPLIRRSGTVHVLPVKDQTKATRLLPFVFSRTQAFVLEFGDRYVRFYTNHGQVGSGGFSAEFSDEFNKFSTYEVVTPYDDTELFDIYYAQSADILYLAHQNKPLSELRRYGTADWQLVDSILSDGPYLPVNVSDTTCTVTGSGSTRTLTFSSAEGINDDTGFDNTDQGRMIRVEVGGSGENGGWQWVTITSVTSATVVECEADNSNMSNGTATKDWRLGLYCPRNGYPRTVTFSGDRLFLGGCPRFPQRLSASRVGDYYNFAPTDTDGTVADDHALAITLNANEVNDIKWLMDDDKGLVIGTEGGEWLLRPNEQGGVLTPNNIDAKRVTNHGSTDIQPVRAGRSIMFVTSAKQKVRELGYNWEEDGLRAPDATIIAEHITGEGLIEMAYQREPQSIIWTVRSDGVIAALTYDSDNQVIGWHRHLLGGAGVAVESVATIPDPDLNGDELWLVARRTVNGQTMRYIEYMKTLRIRTEPQASSFYVDSGLTYNGTPVTTVGGLDHLEGETVTILADGATHPDKVVTGGLVTLDRAASTITVGLGFTSKMITLRPDEGSADGTAQGKTKRINEVVLRFWESLGGKIGEDLDNLDPIVFRQTSDPLNSAPPLFTGDVRVEWDAEYDSDAQIAFSQSQPLPTSLQAIMPKLVTQDAS